MIKSYFISRMRDQLKFYRLSGATFYDCTNAIYQFIIPFLDNKMSIFEEYGAFLPFFFFFFLFYFYSWAQLFKAIDIVS